MTLSLLSSRDFITKKNIYLGLWFYLFFTLKSKHREAVWSVPVSSSEQDLHFLKTSSLSYPIGPRYLNISHEYASSWKAQLRLHLNSFAIYKYTHTFISCLLHSFLKTECHARLLTFNCM